MLASDGIVRAVADRLRFHLKDKRVPVVLDPVMIAKSGARLLRADAVAALQAELLPLATLVTPNIPELEALTGLRVRTEGARCVAARGLVAKGPAVLVKGGHAAGEEVVDLLLGRDGRAHRFAHPRLRTASTHGTGCTLSSAIAARLGAGEGLRSAVAGAIDYLAGALAAAYPLGAGDGHGPVNHLFELRPVPARAREDETR
ncbi:MAG TPA: PfkB family carbohydrate kinase, partial [Thermoanaerobaculia bacterium]